MKNILRPLAKSVLIPLGLKAPALVTDAAIQRDVFWSGMNTLIINEEMNEIMKIVLSFEYTALLIKIVSETTENKTKEQKVGFLDILLYALGASLFGNLLRGKEVTKAVYLSTNFEIQKYYKNETKNEILWYLFKK